MPCKNEGVPGFAAEFHHAGKFVDIHLRKAAIDPFFARYRASGSESATLLVGAHR
jgi:hypothetical protein